METSPILAISSPFEIFSCGFPIFSPLPPSLKISLEQEYRSSTGANEVYETLRSMKGVESVIYRKALLEFIDQKTATLHNITLGLGLLISLSAIFLVTNTIRLAIYAKRRLLRTMELVGATSGFIRLPFLLEGVLQGFLGAVLGLGMLYAFFLLFLARVYEPLKGLLGNFPVQFLSCEQMVAMGLGGVVLGLFGTQVSVGRYLRL